MDDFIRIKAIVKKHKDEDDTGMYHLDDYFSSEDKETGKDKRKRLFPVGTEIMIKPAHWYDDIQVFNAYNKNDDFDYFNHKEIFIIETEKLFETYPNAGYGNDKEYFNEYMNKFNKQN